MINFDYLLLILICIIAIIVLTVNIGVVNKRNPLSLRWTCILLFTFSMTRYLTLIVYGDSPTLEQLESLRYFYLATSIGLTMTTASAVWYISPYIKERISYVRYLLLFLPWIIFYIFVLVTQPTEIVMGASYGYALELTGNFPIYLSIAQGSFVLIMIVLCLIGIVKYKNTYFRSKYWLIIGAQILLTLDGLRVLREVPLLGLFPPFTITEVFGFLAVLYAFTRQDFKRRG